MDFATPIIQPHHQDKKGVENRITDHRSLIKTYKWVFNWYITH